LARIVQLRPREIHMTWKDKLELGLKNDAGFRKDNLPEQQVRGAEIPAGPGRSPVIPAAIDDVVEQPDPESHEAVHEEETPGIDNEEKISNRK
jgi:hypothetical protein